MISWAAIAVLIVYVIIWMLGTGISIAMLGPKLSNLRGMIWVIVNVFLLILGNWYVFGAWTLLNSVLFIYENSESEGPLTGEVVFIPMKVRILAVIMSSGIAMGMFGIFQLIA